MHRSYSQFYRPFPEGEAVWTLQSVHIDECPLNSNAFTVYNSYIIQTGDTIFNGNTYHKIYREPFIGPPTGIPYSFADTGYVGALRQNISLKQVYVFFKDDSIERLLCDFSIDTIGAPFPNTIQKPDNSAKLIVVDTLWLVNSNVFTLHFIYSDTVTNVCGDLIGYEMSEGVGGGGGLISRAGYFVAPGTSNYLLSEYVSCLSEDGILVAQPYNDTIIASSDSEYCVTSLTAGLTELPGGYHINVFPNPAINEIYIACNDLPGGHQYFYSIVDLLGNKFIQQEIQPAGTNISCNNLTPGLYLWQFTNEQGYKLTEGKLVIQK